MKKIILILSFSTALVSCNSPISPDAYLPDEYYDARLEGTWQGGTENATGFKVLTFERLYGRFIGTTTDGIRKTGSWNALEGMGELVIWVNGETETRNFVYEFIGDFLILNDDINFYR